jgi:uncharacterized YccA/Bax inhibitor family protein
LYMVIDYAPNKTKSSVPFINGSGYLCNAGWLEPPAGTGIRSQVLTSHEVAQKTGFCLVMLVAGMFVGWFVIARLTAAAGVGLAAQGAGVGLPSGAALVILGLAVAATVALALINALRLEPSPVLILAYCVCSGVLVGALSLAYAHVYNGIVSQAVIATLCVVVASWALFSTGIVKAHQAKVTKFILVAICSYLLLSIVNIIMMVTGVWGGAGIWSGLWGIALSLFAVLLGGLMLAADLTHAQDGVRAQIPARYAWSLAYAITLDVVWIYLEILRLLALLNRK